MTKNSTLPWYEAVPHSFFSNLFGLHLWGVLFSWFGMILICSIGLILIIAATGGICECCSSNLRKEGRTNSSLENSRLENGLPADSIEMHEETELKDLD